MNATPTILDRKETRLSAWTSLVARAVRFSGKAAAEEYHSLRQADYVLILAETVDEKIPLVRQYRPVIEDYTLEFPAGLRDGDEPPEQAALRELVEEVGLNPVAPLRFIGCYAPDVGRLENKLWAFQATVANVTVPGWKPEPGIEPVLVTKSQLRAWMQDGTFNHALHIALIGAAMTQGTWEWNE